ncbi:hypothetical protein P4H61_21980 [Paenibacillus peoriae]|uniref:hypothetical protein n=1 Tax=Paenibacillus peoriae TaxID=59893 RepID=UPI00026C64B8|nr:hypothetical protein [Paenibacillus peoriae]MEC0184161.1 hypothetical protein [Paenibacillus peoriae]
MEKIIQWYEKILIRRLRVLVDSEKEAVFKELYQEYLNQLYSKYGRPPHHPEYAKTCINKHIGATRSVW